MLVYYNFSTLLWKQEARRKKQPLGSFIMLDHPLLSKYDKGLNQWILPSTKYTVWRVESKYQVSMKMTDGCGSGICWQYLRKLYHLRIKKIHHHIGWKINRKRDVCSYYA